LSAHIIFFKNMPIKKKKTIKQKRIRGTKSGFSKFASLTTASLTKAYLSYKKNQEISKIKEIKLRKLEENNQILKGKKRT